MYNDSDIMSINVYTSSLSLMYFSGVKARAGRISPPLSYYATRLLSQTETEKSKIIIIIITTTATTTGAIDRENPASGNYYGGITARNSHRPKTQ